MDPGESDRIKPKRGVFGGGGGRRGGEGWIVASPTESDRIRPIWAVFGLGRGWLAAVSTGRFDKSLGRLKGLKEGGDSIIPSLRFVRGVSGSFFVIMGMEFKAGSGGFLLFAPYPARSPAARPPPGVPDRHWLFWSYGRKCSKCHAQSVAWRKISRRSCAALEIARRYSRLCGGVIECEPVAPARRHAARAKCN